MTETILLTGASGYIAKHIVVALLDAGYAVRGTVRNLDRGQEVRDAVAPALADPKTIDGLDFVALDLGKDDGWDVAMEGVSAVLHTASPFPMAQPKDEAELIKPAVDGALRALRAANKAGVKRVVMTSSVVSVTSRSSTPERPVLDESDWTDPTDPSANPYARSKTLAEKAAWDYAEAEAPDMALTMINPGLVVGPPLDKNYGTSIRVVERLLKATDPMLPRVGFTVVDVRDVAKMHVAALSTPESVGKRIIATEKFAWFVDFANTLKAEFPNRKIVTRLAPNFMIRLIGLFDPAIRSILPSLGKRVDMSNERAQSLFGMTFRDTDESVKETAHYLVDNNLV